MLWVRYKAKGEEKAKRTFFSSNEEFTVWMMKQYEKIEIKKMSYGGKNI